MDCKHLPIFQFTIVHAPTSSSSGSHINCSADAIADAQKSRNHERRGYQFVTLSNQAPDVLMVSLQCTEGKPLVYSWYPSSALNTPSVLMITPTCILASPSVLMIISQCTEHPQCTHDIPQCTHDIPQCTEYPPVCS